MAAEFEAKMDTSGIEAFARDFVKKYRAGLTDALIKSANQMVGALQVSTQTTLEVIAVGFETNDE